MKAIAVEGIASTAYTGLEQGIKNKLRNDHRINTAATASTVFSKKQEREGEKIALDTSKKELKTLL